MPYEPSAARSRSRAGRTRRLFLRLALLVLAVGLCVAVLAPQVPSWGSLWVTARAADWRFAALAIGLFTLHTTLVLVGWHRALALVGVPTAFLPSARIFSLSLLTRYLPGGIWHLGTRLAALSLRGADPVRVGFSLLLEQLAALLMCALLVALLLGIDPTPLKLLVAPDPTAAVWWPLPVATLTCALILLYPPVFGRVLAAVARTLHRPCPPPPPAVALFGLYALHALALLVFAAAYMAAARMYGPALPLGPAGFAGAVLTATLTGFLAPFVPGGLGVREALLALLLRDALSGPALAAVVLAPRLLLVLAEVALLALVLLLPLEAPDD